MVSEREEDVACDVADGDSIERRDNNCSINAHSHLDGRIIGMSALLWAGAAVRAVLLAIGGWQDAHLRVKYTDIDYEVYTDAAAYMASGQSPYTRSTYRYTPLLAAALVPNATLHKAWGKLLFCGADLLAAGLLQALMVRRGVSPRLQAWGIAIWLFSPFTVAISTRGNGEALVTCMLLGLLLALEQGRIIAAGLLFGLAVHWRVYPIIFALPILRHLALAAQQQQQRQRRRQPSQPGILAARAQKLGAGILSWQGCLFGATSGALFLGLAALFYRLYGSQFLHEGYLYHATRTDPRHNFSSYFYPAYLASAGDSGASNSWEVGWAFTAAQAALQLALGWRCAGDLPFCLLLQTVVLVAFNKVCTAQYFVWYISFLPLVLPQLAAAPNRGRLLGATLAWAAAMGHWLGWAYALEFQGLPVHLGVWAASLIFFAAHVWLICELLSAWRHSDRRPAVQAVPKKQQ